MAWMAWTLPTAVFFGAIALLIASFTALAVYKPSAPRRGILPIETTRGDRLFLGLLGSAYINLAWIALTDLSQWGALGLSIVFLSIILKWG
jgi:predicted small integral membrane protein